jgi:energy-coupling factor transport system ATP-binding protein
LAELNRQGQTIIVITHEMELVAKYAKRTIVLNGGRVLLDGPTNEVFAEKETLSLTYVKPPQIADLAHRLRARNCPKLLTIDEMVSAIHEALPDA